MRSSAPAARPTRTNWSTALEKTDHVGTIGRIQFYGRMTNSPIRSNMARAWSPAMLQWQDGKQRQRLAEAENRQRQD
jgi:hypothetical protein